MSLNQKQLEAVNSDSKRMLVVAGAGTGKTRALTHRIARVIGEGVSPYNILAITFTRKAAGEMRTRLEAMLPKKDIRKLRIGTFHSVCLDVVKSFGDLLGYRKNLSIYDEVDRKDILESIIKDLGLKLSTKKVLKVKESLLRGTEPESSANEILVIMEYENTLRRYNAIDYFGLLEGAVKLLKNPRVQEHYHNLYRYVFVDEYQDTDPLQYEFLMLLQPEQLFVVGDYRQSIYGWRGARPELLFEFAKGEAQRVDLVQNYRSLPKIIEFTNSIITDEEHYGKKLVGVRQSTVGPQVWKNTFYGMLDEASFIAETINELISHNGNNYSDIAVFARKNRTLEDFSQWLTVFGQGIPNVRIGAQADFWKHEEIRLCVNALRLLNNPDDNHSLKSILRTLKIEVPEFKRLEWLARKKQIPLLEALPDDLSFKARFKAACSNLADMEESFNAANTLLTIANYLRLTDWYIGHSLMTRAKRICEMGDFLTKKGWTVEEFLSWFAWREIQDELIDHEKENKVRLMTVHAAKGLEFPVVFVMGLTAGDFPAAWGEPEEEQRLFYVACTRAEDQLILTCSQVDERGKKKYPSKFLALEKVKK